MWSILKNCSKNNLPLHIASRYLFARKSHNVINVISAISAAGIAVGTAAIIIILSVFNGFDALVKGMMSNVEPDILVVPAKGKFFVPDSAAFDWAYHNPQIKTISSVLQDNVFFTYGDRQGTAVLKGVDEVYEDESPVREKVTDGTWELTHGERRFAAVGAGVASTYGINPHFTTALEFYYPERGARISSANPMESVNTFKIWPSCRFSINAQTDGKLIIVSRDVMCELTGCTNEVSAVELRMQEGCTQAQTESTIRELSERLGPDFKVLDRAHQNPDLYKMLRYEKFAVFGIMIFIVLILGFSIFGSLRMLIIDKKQDIATLRAMGMDRRDLRRTFLLEGWLISLLGAAVGTVTGVALSLAQQHYGLVKIKGAFAVSAYPVVLDPMDVLLCCGGVILLGYIIARAASKNSADFRKS